MTRYRKAYAAFTAAVLTTIGILWDGALDAGEASALAATWLGVGAVFFFPNDTPEGEPADPDMSERGSVTPGVVTAVASVVMALILILWAFDTGLIG